MTAGKKKRVCKDCGNTKRAAKYPGPRCFTCHKQRQAALTATRRSRHIEQKFGITEAEYQAIYQAQGGVCYLCRRARGNRRVRLAVDHDHRLARLHNHPADQGCRECVRGLLCKKCNRDVLGHLRDDITAFQRCIEYLTNPPARRVLGAFPRP